MRECAAANRQKTAGVHQINDLHVQRAMLLFRRCRRDWHEFSAVRIRKASF
jgi:hypothetical protein